MANENTASTASTGGASTGSESQASGVQTQGNTQADSTQNTGANQGAEQSSQIANITNDVAVKKPEAKAEEAVQQVAEKLNVNEMIAKQLNGELSDADKAALEKAGLSEDQLNVLADAHKQVQLKNNDILYESVGGKETYEELKTFALENLSDDEIDVYNEAMRHPNFKIAQLATLGLHAMMQKHKGGSKPQERLSADGEGGARGDAYSSQQELINDMKHWKYGRDAEYTADVDRKRAKSGF